MKRRRLKVWVGAGAAMAGLGAVWAGCQAVPEEREEAAAGAVVGGVLGAQAEDEAEGALIGAATGALLGEALKGLRDEEGNAITDDDVDFGSLMTEAEKARVHDRANRESIDDWSRYLTQAEKQQLVERSSAGVGVLD